MDDSPKEPPSERVVRSLERDAPEIARDRLDTLDGAPLAERKETLRALRRLAEEEPAVVGEISSALTGFLTDEERSIRLTTAKLFVVLATDEPEIVVPVVPDLAERLADDEEFYYVRARCGEALGYVALDHPEAVDDPEILADFRVGLSVDEPEVTEKLAKGLEYVALGDPSRLRHQVPSLAEHLDDANELVRYHLCTALVAIGCADPTKLTAAAEDLRRLLDDESPYVRGRAVEALGLLRTDELDVESQIDTGRIRGMEDDAPTFLTERLAFYRSQVDADPSQEAPDGVGAVESVREGTDEVLEAMTVPETDVCAHCGLDLPEAGPPMCPQCGAPR